MAPSNPPRRYRVAPCGRPAAVIGVRAPSGARAASGPAQPHLMVEGPEHALRTPLTAIAGALGLLGAGVAGELPESAHSLLQIALRNCQALESAVETHLARGATAPG